MIVRIVELDEGQVTQNRVDIEVVVGSSLGIVQFSFRCDLEIEI